jgi:hypothetical protein
MHPLLINLEFRTKEGSRLRRRIKQKSVLAVLDEQDIQRDEGLYDPDFICDAYKEVTGPSSLEALNRGLKDQKAMLELLDPNDRLERDRRMAPIKKKSVDVPKMSRRRSKNIPEICLNDNYMQARRIIAAPK